MQFQIIGCLNFIFIGINFQKLKEGTAAE